MVTAVPSSLPTKGVAAYLAGYLLSKIPVDTCQDCPNQLMLPKLPSPYDELSVYKFLWHKTYQEAGCLVYPTPAMITFVDRLETLSLLILSFPWRHYSHATCTSKIMSTCADDFCTFQKCTEVQCSLWLKIMSSGLVYESTGDSMLWKDPMYRMIHRENGTLLTLANGLSFGLICKWAQLCWGLYPKSFVFL